MSSFVLGWYQVGGLVVAVCSNLALAYMHLENYERAVQYGKQVRARRWVEKTCGRA